MSRPEPTDLTTLVHEWRVLLDAGIRRWECTHCPKVTTMRDTSALCPARVEQERRRAFEAGYDCGYGNGHADSNSGDDDPDPGMSYEAWLGADELEGL